MSRALFLSFRSMAGALVLAVPLLAGAQQLAYVAQQMNLRAGPAVDYPVVAVMQPGVQLTVYGCTPGYQWCDVQLSDGLRGWAYAPYLGYPQYGRSIALPNAAVSIGIPILAFTLGSYWADHYRDRPWYDHPRWNPRPAYPRPGPRTWSWEDRDDPRHPGRRHEDARRPPRAGDHWDSGRTAPPRPQARPERRDRPEAQRPQPQRAQPQRPPEPPPQPRGRFDGNNPPNDPAGANRP